MKKKILKTYLQVTYASLFGLNGCSCINVRWQPYAVSHRMGGRVLDMKRLIPSPPLSMSWIYRYLLLSVISQEIYFSSEMVLIEITETKNLNQSFVKLIYHWKQALWRQVLKHVCMVTFQSNQVIFNGDKQTFTQDISYVVAFEISSNIRWKHHCTLHTVNVRFSKQCAWGYKTSWTVQFTCQRPCVRRSAHWQLYHAFRF